MLVSNSMLLHEMLVDRSKTTSYWGLALFSGTRPTSDKLREMIYGSFLRYRSDVSFLTGFLTSLNGKLVLRLYGAGAVIEVTEDKVLMRLGQTVAKAASLLDDAPTWGVIHFDCTANSDDFQGRRMVYFTVGDENSSADMKIQGGTIPKGSEWKPNDVTINFA